MKIIFIDWKCFDREETKEALRGLGAGVIPFFHEDYNSSSSERFDKAFKSFVKKHGADAVFSYNYFPAVAIACKDMGLIYISFLYDSPYSYIYSYTLAFPKIGRAHV